MTTNNDEMREAYQNIFGREWESEAIMLREYDSAQQSGFQAAYQLQQKKIDGLEERLEVAPDHEYDGIYCRNETIKLLDERIARLQAKLDIAVEALEGMVSYVEPMLDKPEDYNWLTKAKTALQQIQKGD